MMLLLYITKVFIASGILFGYYWLFLRNKKFHHYNRFYLLAALMIPIVISFISIPVFSDPDNTVKEVLYQTITTISTELLNQSNAEAEITSGNEWGWRALITAAYLIVCLVLFIIMLKTFFYIIKLRRRYPFESVNQFKIYDTGEPGTPFSFFHSIFWNRELPLNSKEGQQIFRHELFHVQQKHSADILFAEFVSSIFWINPFFHLIKKELRAIHEFLADQYAVKNEDSTEYAQLLVQRILQARTLAGSNYFFQTHIKRRIAMITQLKNKKYGYWSRLMVLPVTVLLFCGIALYAGQAPAQTTPNKKAPVQKSNEKVLMDTLPEESRKKLKAEFDALQFQKRKLEEAHQKELNEVRHKQKLLLEKMGTEKEMMKAIQENEQKLRIESDLSEKNLLQDKIEKLKTTELLNLKRKVLSEQQGKVLEQQKLKQNYQLQNKIQLQQEKLLQDKMQLLKEYQLDKTKQDLLLEQKIKDLNQNEIRLKILSDQKQLALVESNQEAQKLLLNKQLDLQKQQLIISQDESFLKQLMRHYNKNMRYPQELLDVNKEGFVYVSLELNEKGELKDYIIHNSIPFTDGRIIYEMFVVSMVTKKISEPSGKVDYQAIFNNEVEKVTKKYKPQASNSMVSPDKVYLKIVFKLEQETYDKLILKEPE